MLTTPHSVKSGNENGSLACAAGIKRLRSSLTSRAVQQEGNTGYQYIFVLLLILINPGRCVGFFERRAGELSPRIRRRAMDLARRNPLLMRRSSNCGDLMIAVSERFTPWRTLSSRLQDIDRGTGRLRRRMVP